MKKDDPSFLEPEEQQEETVEDVARELHLSLGKDLLERIRTGQATTGELDQARKFLVDNKISGVPAKKSSLLKLSDQMRKHG